MADKNDISDPKTDTFQTRRKRAEKTLAAGAKPLKDMSASEMSTLIHELQIHKVELEMQNEELRKSQAETDKSRRAFQDLWELSPVGYLIVDTAGHVSAVNRAGQRLFGKPENALLNEPFATLMAMENQVPAHLMLERTVETGIVERQEVRIKKPDGAVHICLLEVRSLEGEPGREQIQAVLTDITQQKRAEDDLRKNEQEKIAILDSLMEHVIYHDREMKTLWANKAACKSAHMKREDLLAQKCHEFWDNSSTPCEDCPVIKARDTGQPQMVEKMTLDGRWWQIQGHPMRDKNGRITGMTELTLDITERKRAEEIIRNAQDDLETKVKERTGELMAANEKLRQEIKVRIKAEKKLQASEMLLSTTFDALQDLMIVIDKDFRVVMSNWKDHDYISEKDRQEHPFCYEVLLNRNKPCDPCHALEVFATGEIRQLELTNPIDGKVRDIRMLPMFDDHGEVVAVIEHCRDITEHKRMQESLKDSENRFHELFNHMRNGVAVYQAVDNGEDFIFLDFNETAERIDNFKKENLIGKRMLEMYPGIKKFGLFDVLQRVWFTGNSEQFPVKIYKGDRISSWRENYVYRLPSGEIVAVYDDVTERIQAQEAMQKSEARYRALSDATFEAIFISEGGICLDTNQRATEMFGYEHDELLGIFGTDVIAPESRELVRGHMLSGYEKPYEAIAQRKDGTTFHAEICGKMTRYKDKNVRVTVIRDLSERKQAEAELRQSEEKYRTILDTIEEVYFEVDLGGNFIFFNDTLPKYSGYTRDELMDMNNREYTTAQTAKRMYKTFNKIYQTENRAKITDFEIIKKDGSKRIVELSASLIRDLSGRPAGFRGVARDIMERKQTEEALRESKERFRTLVENAPFGFSIMKPDRRFAYFNPKFTELFGYTLDNIPDKDTWFTKAYPDKNYRKRVRRVWEQDSIKETEDGEVISRTYNVTGKDGQDKTIRFNNVALSDGKQMLTYEDITSQVAAEEALKNSKEKLRYLTSSLLKSREEERQRISFGLHDELGQDLAALKMSLKSIENRLRKDQKGLKKECESTRQYVDHIVENVRRISQGLSPMILQDLGLTATLKWIIQNFIEQTHIEVFLDMANIDHLFSEEAEIIIYRIFQEAFTNIRKHSRATHVSVRIKKEKNSVATTIEDNGSGFDMQEVAARNWPAKGLGLTTMEERVRILGGPFERFSRKGQGTRITLAIPITKKGGE